MLYINFDMWKTLRIWKNFIFRLGGGNIKKYRVFQIKRFYRKKERKQIVSTISVMEYSGSIGNYFKNIS